MADNQINIDVPGLESVLHMLGKLDTKYGQLKEGEELCKSLHERFVAFANQLMNITSDTYQAKDILTRLQTLIEEFTGTVEKYINESNFVKRLIKLEKFSTKIKVYNESLDSIYAMTTVNQTMTFAEWQAQYDQDMIFMTSKLKSMKDLQRNILRGLRRMSNQIEETVLEVKRDLGDVSDDSDMEGAPHPLDPVLRSFVKIAEEIFLSGKVVKTPPSWLIAADEVTTLGEIDSKGRADILLGEWQGVRVAVKKSLVVDKHPVFNTQCMAWYSLLHPNVAQLFGAGSDRGLPFFVYEYASLKSLDLCWDQLSQREVYRLLYQAALGLSYLHNHDIVHGNLSCSKLLVGDEGIVKLIGFGVSYFRENDKSSSIRLGTLEISAAPECIGVGPDGVRHSPRYESDVYSFGLTIIEAISKKKPFDGFSNEDMRFMKMTNQLQKPQTMSSELWSLVQQMCVKDPSRRVSITFVTEQLKQYE